MLLWLHNHYTILCKYGHPLKHILTNVHIMYCYFCVCTLCCVCTVYIKFNHSEWCIVIYWFYTWVLTKAETVHRPQAADGHA